MLEHIVMWKLKEQSDDGTKIENAAAIKQGLEGLIGKIDGLLSAQVLIGLPGGMDLCLISKFENKEALKNYAVHPLHQQVLKLIQRSSLERVALDTEI